jgi:hypothetical protein
LSNPNTSEKSVELDRQENITKGNVSAKKVVLYTYDALTDTLLPSSSTKVIKFAPISASTSGDNVIVAAVTGKKIKVISVVLVASGVVSVTWKSATTNLSGAMPLVANSGFSLPTSPNINYFETAVGEVLNLNLSSAVLVAGHLGYYEE